MKRRQAEKCPNSGKAQKLAKRKKLTQEPGREQKKGRINIGRTGKKTEAGTNTLGTDREMRRNLRERTSTGRLKNGYIKKAEQDVTDNVQV